MQQVRYAPVEEDVDEDEKGIGDGDGEDIGDSAAQSHKLHADCGCSVAEGDQAYQAEPRSAAVNQEQVKAKAGEDDGRDVDSAKVYHNVILLSSWIEHFYLLTKMQFAVKRLIDLGVGFHFHEAYTERRRLSLAAMIFVGAKLVPDHLTSN
jgi:hypothetical protein